MKFPRKTKIVCTIGPACLVGDMISSLINAGMNIARINCSHGVKEEHLLKIKKIREAEQQCKIPVAILLDTKGPEIRTGSVTEGAQLHLQPGNRVILTTKQQVAEVLADGSILLSINYSSLPSLVNEHEHIFIADGIIDLVVVQKTASEITCRIQSGGTIGSYKNINIPGVSLPLPAISPQDVDDILFGIENGIDFIAASFIRSATDVVQIRQIAKNQKNNVRIIAKIENQEGVDNLEEIIEVSDGIMIARGDLGIQLKTERVPLVQKMIIGACNRAGKPVITATQMLESMVKNPRPTRAEMTDVANAIFDGTDAVMLSAETAVGLHPIKSVETLHKISLAVEHSKDFIAQMESISSHYVTQQCSSDAVAKSSCLLAREINATGIVVYTINGNGPRLIARYRNPHPVIAVGVNTNIVRQLLLNWGIVPILTKGLAHTEEMLANAMAAAQEYGFIQEHDWVVTVAGLPLSSPITLNTIRVRYIGKVLRRAKNAFGYFTQGVITKIDDPSLFDADATVQDAILVTHQLTKSYIDIIPHIKGIISELPSTLTPAEIRAHNATVVSLEEIGDACQFFKEGQRVSINGLEKTVYEH